MSDKEQFKQFRADLLASFDPFKDVITHIYLRRRKDGQEGVEAAAEPRDQSLKITAVSKKPVSEFQNVACLGNLSYLKSVVQSSYLKKDAKLELSYDVDSKGKGEALRHISFSGGKGFKTHYQATDPYIDQLGRVKPVKIEDWPVAFYINVDVVKNFEEIHKINASAPKIGSDLDDVFHLVYEDGKIEGIFGDHGNQSSVILSDIAEAEEEEEDVKRITALFSISRLRFILKQIGKGEAMAYLCSKGLKIDTETEHAKYQFVMQAKRMAQ
jgi:hypothetical protein